MSIVNFNYLSDFGIFAMSKFRQDVETFQIAKIEEGKDIEFLETADHYFVPMLLDGTPSKIRPAEADNISLPESTIEGEARRRIIIGDPVTLAFDLLKKLGLNLDLGIGFKYERESIVKFCFENIQCEARAVNFEESQGSLKRYWDKSETDIGNIEAYMRYSQINYNSSLGREKINKFVEEIMVDETTEAKQEREENEDSAYYRKQEINHPKYYVVSTVLKSNKFKISFYNSKDIGIKAKFNLSQGISLQAGFQVSTQQENTLEYISDDNYLVFGVQLIPFYLGLRGSTRSIAKPQFYWEFNKRELRKWTGEIFNQAFNQTFNNQLINSIKDNQ